MPCFRCTPLPTLPTNPACTRACRAGAHLAAQAQGDEGATRLLDGHRRGQLRRQEEGGGRRAMR